MGEARRDQADPRLMVTPRMFGIYRGVLTSGFNHWRGDAAPAQPLHKGWDVVAASGVNIRALSRCEVVRVRDNDSVSGYHQEITVWDPLALTYILYGHVARGIQHSVGDWIGEGDIIAKIGTSYDAMGTTPHAHIQCWKDAYSMRTYLNSAAIDPGRVRSFYRTAGGVLL